MKMKKTIAMIMAMTMITGAFAACGEKEEGTPHTTYSVDEINNMSNDELEKALENAAAEIEASEKAEQETTAPENEGIDLWKDVEVTFSGAEGFMKVSVEYVGDNQIIKDNVEFGASWYGEHPVECIRDDKYKNGSDYIVSAWYDAAALAEQGVVLKKGMWDHLERLKAINPAFDYSPDKWKDKDQYCYTISGLGSKVEITDATDVSVFADVVYAVSEKIKSEAQNGDAVWGEYKDLELVPTEFHIEANDYGYCQGCIHYADKEGNFVNWVIVREFNYVNEDGTWIKDLWGDCDDPSLIGYGAYCTVGEKGIKVDF